MLTCAHSDDSSYRVGLLSAHLFALDVLSNEQEATNKAQQHRQTSFSSHRNTDSSSNRNTDSNTDSNAKRQPEEEADEVEESFQYDGRLLEMAIDLGDRYGTTTPTVFFIS